MRNDTGTAIFSAFLLCLILIGLIAVIVDSVFKAAA